MCNMKAIDLNARSAKEIETIKRKVAAMVKNVGCNTGEIRWHQHAGDFNGWSVEVENDGKLCDRIVDIVTESPTGMVARKYEHPGFYDWQADVFIRPVSCVYIKF